MAFLTVSVVMAGNDIHRAAWILTRVSITPSPHCGIRKGCYGTFLAVSFLPPVSSLSPSKPIPFSQRSQRPFQVRLIDLFFDSFTYLAAVIKKKSDTKSHEFFNNNSLLNTVFIVLFWCCCRLRAHNSTHSHGTSMAGPLHRHFQTQTGGVLCLLRTTERSRIREFFFFFLGGGNAQLDFRNYSYFQLISAIFVFALKAESCSQLQFRHT